jgi:hypothetical protein
MKKVGVILGLITALLCLNISWTEAGTSFAEYEVTMKASGNPVTPTHNGNNYLYGNVTTYHKDNLIVQFNTNMLGGATSLDSIGAIYTWPGNSSVWGVEDYYFRITQKPIIAKIKPKPIKLEITYFGSVYANSYNPQIFVEAEMEIRPPEGNPHQLFYLVNSGLTVASGVDTEYAYPGSQWCIHLMGGGFGNFTPTADASLYFHALIDPTVVIDPEFTLYDTEGSPYLAKDLFAVEFSPNLAVPVPGALWLFGSGLLGLAGWRRFRKS